jgi:Fur family transcriptional regulator, ferric uptake regulator
MGVIMKEMIALQKFISLKGLRRSKPREWILEIFLGIERHVSIDELWAEVRKKYPSVGYATVYRTLKLFCEGGLCREIRFEDNTTRYEHLYEHEHHDHLICTRCGTMVEVRDDNIEKLQTKLMKHYGFLPEYHRMNLYGICKACRTS